MSTGIATLRQRAIELLGALRQLPFLAGQPTEVAPELRANAPQIFKLAYIAVGDVDSAAVLTADVLAQAPANEGMALQALVEGLPQGWLSWPGAAGPSEWLALRLRREQADRLLSVLGEWDAQERIALALHLLWGVRRDDLDLWLGTHGMADLVTELVGYVGEGLNLVEPRGSHAECAEIAADLLDMDDPQIGRSLRLHTMGCDACRRRARGLRRTADLLRQALHVFFRASLPANFDQLIQTRRRERQPHVHTYWKPALVVVTLLALYMGLFRQTTPVEIAQAAPPPNAAELLDRALHRFTQQPTPNGVLHERVRVGTGDTAMVLERWYDYRSPQRLRVTVRPPDQAAAVFDLATNGTDWIAYEINTGSTRPLSALVRNPDIAALMPLLRQLPFVSSFSRPPVDQEHMDLALLAQAQRGQPTLLGTTIWQGRPAYMLASRSDKAGRVILTIDQATLSILEARVAPDVAGTTQTQRVWEADVVEVLPRSQLPPNTFELTARSSVISEINPRQYELNLRSNLNLRTAVRSGALPIPTTLPEPALITHLQDLSGINSEILQLYEGEWSTLAVVAPRIRAWPVPMGQMNSRFAHGRFSLQRLEMPQATMAWFVMDDAPHKVMQLYFWHALADDAERDRIVEQILDSMVLVDEHNVDAYSERFLPANGTEQKGSLRLPQNRSRANAGSSIQSAQRRYMRSKLEQTYQYEQRPSELGLRVR
jgi:hypothetical protein